MTSHELYRCAFIVRGRAQKQLDDLLPAFALAVEASTPLPHDEFKAKMRTLIQSLVPGGIDNKTADNYRTETIGQILGMYYFDEKGVAQMAPRTRRYLQTQNQVEFFKNVCCLLQAPSGMSKKVDDFIKKGVKIWPVSFIIRTLRAAKNSYGYRYLGKKEVNFFILSNLDALRGRVSPDQVAAQIDAFRRTRKPVPLNGGSNLAQHSNEVVNLCKYANLVSITGDTVALNDSEAQDADKIINYQTPENWFSVEEYDLATPGGRDRLNRDWTRHYAQLPFPNEINAFASIGSRWALEPIEVDDTEFDIPKVGLPKTPITSTKQGGPKNEEPAYTYNEPAEITANEIGEAGEQYVWVQEQRRIKKSHSEELNRIKRVGGTKGLGYDVHSVLALRARNKSETGNAIFIEVKAEFRPIPPKDSFVAVLTANEFKAARQFKDTFFLFKVFFVGPAESQQTFVFSLQNPVAREAEGISVIPSEDEKHYTITFRRHHCEEILYD